MTGTNAMIAVMVVIWGGFFLYSFWLGARKTDA